MKKILAAVMAVIMTLTSFPVCAIADSNQETQAAGTDSANAAADFSLSGYIEPDVRVNDVPHAAGNEEGLLGASATDAQYDLRNSGFVSGIRNQGVNGVCWSFAVLASAESGIMKAANSTQDVDLSELQMGWYTYNRSSSSQPAGCEGDTVTIADGKSYGSIGGNSLYALLSLMRRAGFVPEADGVFTPLTVISNPGFNDSVMAFRDNSYVLQNADIVDGTNTDAIKQLILQHGAVAASAGMYDAYYNDETDALYCPYCASNHAIAIIGWDDNYSKSNFMENHQPSADGAWIVKNSAGNYGNHGGYFYLSYEDASFTGNEVVSFQAIPAAEASDNLYQYDGGLSYAYLMSDKNLFMANVFTANSAETLKAVQFFTDDSGTQYKVKVYADVTKDPGSGTLVSAATVSGKMDYAGYHTVNLASSVPLSENEKYAVAVELISSDTNSVHACYEASAAITDSNGSSLLTSATHIDSGESYWSNGDGTIWRDNQSHNGNFLLKALTDDTVLAISTNAAVSGTYYTGDAFSAVFTATGTTPIVLSYAGIGTETPPGLSFTASTGALAGVFTSAGTYKIRITAQNSLGKEEKDYEIKVLAAPVILTKTLAEGTARKAYAAVLSGSCDSSTSLSWSLSSGELPAGLLLNSDGTITGTPAADGTYQFTAKAQDTNGRSATSAFILTVAPAASHTITFRMDGCTNQIDSITDEEGSTADLSALTAVKNATVADAADVTITFDAGGSTVSAVNKMQTSTAYTLTGWKAVNGDDTLYTGSYTIGTSDVTLYPVFSASETRSIKSVGTMPANPEKTGGFFKGWFTAENGGTRVTDLSSITEDTRLYAHWTVYTPAEDGKTYLLIPKGSAALAVDAAAGGIMNFTKLQLYGQNGSEAQLFRLEKNSDGTFTILSSKSELAVDIPGASSVNGTRLQLYESNKSGAQKWKAVLNADGTYTFINAVNGKAIDVQNGQCVSGAAIQLYTSNGSSAQRFSLREMAAPDITYEGMHILTSALNGRMVMDISGGSVSSGANVQIWTSNGTKAQSFNFIYSGNGYYRIINEASGKALDVAGANRAAGANVQQYTWNGSNAQLWKITENSDQTITLTSRLGTVADVSGGSSSNGANVQTYSSNGTKAQKWHLNKAG